MDLPLHPAARLFPSLSEPELERLTDHIRRFGLRRPIVLHEGAILDGRARWEACRRAGVPPRFTEWDGEGSPLEWLVSENVGRRHLGPSQRALIALGLMPLLQAEARADRRRKRGRPKKGAHQCALFSKAGKPQKRRLTEVAARLVGVSGRYVQMVKRLARVFPEVLPAIAGGKINLRDAQRPARLDHYRRDRLVEALDDQASAGEDLDIRRMLRKTLEQRLPRVLAARVEPASPPPAAGPADDEIAYAISLTHRQVRTLQRGEPIRVVIGARDFLVACRGTYDLVRKRGCADAV